MKISLDPSGKAIPKKGKILLAEPLMDDPNFKRSVVLLCEHGEDGSFGFVLNNYIEVSVDDVFGDFPKLDSRISIGGPVHSSNLYYIHQLGSIIPGSIEIMEGLCIGGDFDALIKAIENGLVGGNDVRFFQGCSGWSANQLDLELEYDSWYVTDVPVSLLMDTKVDNLWNRIMEGMGPKAKFLSTLTSTPSLN